MSEHALERFFWPESIAVLGASPDKHRIRGLLLSHLIRNGYTGRILPINPSYQEIDGLRCFPSLAEAGGPIDLALIAIPAAAVPAAARECAAAGVKGALIISSGFAEEGGTAGEMQAEVATIARDTGLRICGPNCEGYFNALGRVSTTFSPTVEVKEGAAEPALVSERRVGIVAQSGGIGFSLFNRGKAAGIGFSYVISTGNECDLTMADFMDYMVQDDRTHAIMLFCEAVRNGPAFLDALAYARRRGKPVIAMKIGRSDAGKRAAASHTASLSGSHIAYRAVFQHYGVIEAEDPDEAVAIAGTLLTCPLPKGRRVGIVTPSGGGGAWMADTLSAHGLLVPPLSPDTQERLRPLMPSYGAAGNPVDVTAQGSNTGPAAMTVMEHLAGSDEIDMLVLVSSLASETRVTLDAERIRATAERCAKPVTVWSYTIPSAFGREQAAGCGLFLHTNLRNVGVSLSRLAAFAEALERRLPAAASAVRPFTLPSNLPRIVPEYLAKRLLADYLPPAQERLVQTAFEAVQAAEELGFPVAVKIQSSDLPHKTEVGGVRLGLRDAAAVEGAVGAMLRDVGQRSPQARLDGVLVQKMAPPGHELAIGMVNDPTFGPLIMAGLGGTTIELFGDVMHRPAPVSEAEAEAMILSLRSAPLLTGFRGRKPAHLAPVAALIARLSEAALAYREHIAEMEFNPVILHGDGSGITIADALITLRE